jgi:hypothetical protein
VFVIREEFATEFRSRVAAKYARHLAVDCVFQAMAALPPGFTVPAGREKPWGTGHAVWCAREAINEPFAVIGADDFFGRDAFVQLAAFFSAENPNSKFQIPKFAMAGYRLANTLSEHGAVARGVCAVGPDGRLIRVTERTNLHPEDVGPGREFTGDETVSMNCWAFTPEIFPMLEAQFAAFLFANAGAAPPLSAVTLAQGESRDPAMRGGGTPPTFNPLKSEFYLPEAVSAQIAAGRAGVEVRPTTATWFGVTYREDKARMQAALARLQARGEYPAELFPT